MNVSFGQLLRRYRIEKALSQEQLAGAARLSVESVGALERGTRRAPYRGTVTLLAEALELDPDARAKLEAAADRGRARSRQDARITPHAIHAALPMKASSFMGRERELQSIVALVDAHRLVTVTGSGGVGKTRVVIEVAAQLARTRSKPVLFVDLSPIGDPRFIIGTVASQFGMSLPDNAVVATLTSAIRAAHAVIVLDNCEHLVADIALLVSSVLLTCPGVSFLTTSRERLAVDGEVVYRLPSLEIPDHLPLTVAQARRYSALELFIQRTMMSDSTLVFDDSVVGTISDIVRKLDGIPLAIELASARVSALGLENLRARLGQDLMLMGGARNLPARQQTMLATIRWSYDLLGPLEQVVLARIAVFVGGFALPAAESVCAGDVIEERAVADILSSLVNKSLINVTLAEGHARYSILETVKSFARERLAEDAQTETFALKHAQWIAAFADSIDATRIGKSEQWLRAQTAPELENARAALTWSLQGGSRGHALLAARIVGGLRTIWLTSGRHAECMRWAEAALAGIDQSQHPQKVATLMRALVQSADNSEVFIWAERAFAAYERIGDQTAVALLHSHISTQYRRSGRLDEAAIEISRARAIFANRPQSMPYASFLQSSWEVYFERGCFEDALSDIAEGISLVNSLGDTHAYLWVLFRASVRFAMGFRDEGIHAVEAVLKGTLGDEMVYERENIMGYAMLALYRLDRSELELGVRAARESLLRTRSWTGSDATATLAQTLHVAALAVALQGGARLAARMLGAEEANYGCISGLFWRYTDRLIEPVLLEKLTPLEIECSKAEGAALPLESIIAEALGTLF